MMSALLPAVVGAMPADARSFTLGDNGPRLLILLPTTFGLLFGT